MKREFSPELSETIAFAKTQDMIARFEQNYVRNLNRKYQRGVYDRDKAIKLCEYFYSVYVRPAIREEQGFDPKLDPKERRQFGEYFRDYYEEHYNIMNLGHKSSKARDKALKAWEGKVGSVQQCRLTHDGKEKFVGTHDECFHKLLQLQGQSTHYAMKYGGWKIEPVVVKKKSRKLVKVASESYQPLAVRSGEGLKDAQELERKYEEALAELKRLRKIVAGQLSLEDSPASD